MKIKEHFNNILYVLLTCLQFLFLDKRINKEPNKNIIYM